MKMKDKELKATPDQIGFENLDRSDQAHVERAVRNRFDRRDALKLMMTTGITMSGAYNLLLAGKQAVASTPKSGGALRAAVAVHGPADTLDPNLFTSQIDYSRGRAHYNALCQLDESLAPQPELAESWGAEPVPMPKNGLFRYARACVSMMVRRSVLMMSCGA